MNILRPTIIITAAIGLASCSSKDDAADAPRPKIEVTGDTVFSGKFEGRNDHVVTGGVRIVEDGGSYTIVLADDFSLDGAPAPKVGLGKDGYQKDTQSGALQYDKGASAYKLKAGIDPAAYNEVYIWCEKFDVALGVAKLSATE
jgi:hypothetical protein